jgi:hypothetical protein
MRLVSWLDCFIANFTLCELEFLGQIELVLIALSPDGGSISESMNRPLKMSASSQSC